MQYQQDKDLKNIEERNRNKKERLKQKEKESSAQLIKTLNDKYREIEPYLLQEPSLQKSKILEKHLDNLFQMDGLIYENFAEEHQKIATRILEEINKTKAHLQREKEAQKIQIDLTKGVYKESELKLEQIELLKKHGYIRSRHVPLGQSGPVNYYLKPRHNESTIHFFMTMNIKEFLESKGIQVESPNSRDADIIFTINEQTWAIEIETGSVKKKKPEEFKQKIAQLNRKYTNNWFIILTDRNLMKSYYSSKYNIVKKSQIIDKINEILGLPKSDYLSDN